MMLRTGRQWCPRHLVGGALVVVLAMATGFIKPPPALQTLHELLTEQMELMELAMLKMNRPLYSKDFKAITEALHRHFRANGGIPERGYNTVHSFARWVRISRLNS
jgi:hypothetical protein